MKNFFRTRFWIPEPDWSKNDDAEFFEERKRARVEDQYDIEQASSSPSSLDGVQPIVVSNQVSTVDAAVIEPRKMESVLQAQPSACIETPEVMIDFQAPLKILSASALRKAAAKKLLNSPAALARFHWTDVMREAASIPYIRDMVWKHWNLRPLPIRETLRALTHTNRVTTDRSNVPEQGEDNTLQVEGKVIRLHPHQERALAFMRDIERRSVNVDYSSAEKKRRDSSEGGKIECGLRGGILQLTMGLGKTLIAIVHSLVSPRPYYVGQAAGKGFPTLIVVSKLLMQEWKENGFRKFFSASGSPNGVVKVLYLHKDFMTPSSIAKLDRNAIVEFDFVVTTYDFVATTCKAGDFHKSCLDMGDEKSRYAGKVMGVHCRSREEADNPRLKGAAVLFGTPWERVVADESTRFCNFRTKTYHYMMALYGRFRWYEGSCRPLQNPSLSLREFSHYFF